MPDKFVTNFKIGDETIIIKDPNAMPANDGHFTSPISAPSIHSDSNFTAGGAITAGGNINGENLIANNRVSGKNARFGSADDESDTFVSVTGQNGSVSMNVATNRGLYDDFVSDWILYRGLYEGRESMRSVSTSLFLNGYPLHHPIDTGWRNIGTGSWFKARMVDNRITLRVDSRENVTLTANAWTTIATLPTDFTPGYAYYGTGYPVGANSILHVYVGTDRKVQVYNPTANSINSFSFTAEFYRADTIKRLYVLTYNLGEFANGQGHGMSESDYQAKIGGMQRFFNSLSADIMCFNEYRGYVDSEDQHATRTVLFPSSTWSSLQQTDSTIRNAMASKTALTGKTTELLVDGSSQTKYIRCKTTISGKDIYVYCVHLHPSNATIRSNEMDALIALTQQQVDNQNQDNVMIFGDFNFATEGGEYTTQFNKAVTAGFRLSNGGIAGYIPTWHKNNPTWYIDNILVKGELQIGAVNVPVQAGNIVPSDHLPLWSFVELY